MSKEEYLYPALPKRFVETRIKNYLHRRDIEHEARVLGAITERRMLAREPQRIRALNEQQWGNP